MPQIVGTGLAALDLIVDYGSGAAGYLAGGGGTCANVLAALATMGWKSTLVGAVRRSRAADIVAEDLRAAGVEVDLVFSSEGSVVPIIVEHIRRSQSSRRAQHWFSFDCPTCRRELPRFTASADGLLNKKAHCAHRTDVFFADRLSAEVVAMAVSARQQGAFVMYEPSTISDGRWVEPMLKAAHVVKYSSDHSSKLALAPVGQAIWIETQGAEGLRWKAPSSISWQSVKAPRVSKIVDSCGAGDWFSAGLLFALFAISRDPRFATKPQFENAISSAMLVAGWSCGFLGARGALYDVEATELLNMVGQTVGVNPTNGRRGRLQRPQLSKSICGHCEASG